MIVDIRRPRGLTVLIGGVVAAGIALFVLVLASISTHQIHTSLAAVIVIASLQIFGELRPIRLTREQSASEELSISTAFGLVLMLVSSIGIAIGAQVIAVLLDGILRRRSPTAMVLSVARYTVAFGAAQVVYAALRGETLLENNSAFSSHDVLPSLAAAATLLVINMALISLAVAVRSGDSVRDHLRENLHFMISGSVLATLAPVVAAVMSFNVWLVPLLLLPILAVQRTAGLFLERERQAMHDALTGLPNRAQLRSRVEAICADPKARTKAAVMIVDLDHFKEINDTLGHHIGDALIKAVGERLTTLVREGDVVARLGGDEFALVATGADEAAAGELASRISRSLRDPFIVSGVSLDVQASIGIALSPMHGEDSETLLRRADVALYAAKESRGCFVVYSPDDDLHTPQRLALLGDLRRGIDNNELHLHYQPQCDVRTGQVVGVEALVRWQHPDLGLLMPEQFISTAENTGLIEPLTMQVLELSIAQLARWLSLGFALRMAVNLSVRHLTNLELPGQVAEILRRHGVPPTALTLEVTESTIMADPTRAIAVLGRLREFGIRLAVDDFGTGYSSLSYLRRLDVDELKIDKSFVSKMGGANGDAVIVRSTIELGHNLGLRVVAEGVESAEVWRQLLPLGCDLVQGFYLGAPMTGEQFEQWTRMLPAHILPPPRTTTVDSPSWDTA
ncbi:cyclic Di-GMP phosphodiesterase RmdB [Acidothermaceae bacterium B102]|nr:cyclic Di-GMP phosphodiesterase RmdB [Acidothermaceae bacterium B102]